MQEQTAYERFADRLRQADYATPERYRRAFPDRVFGWSDAWYYIRLFHIVCRANRMAVRKEWSQAIWAGFSLDTLRAVEGCGGHVTLENVAALKRVQGPVVVISNHMSLLETFLLPCVICPFKPLTTIVKESLLDAFVFGPVMRATEPVAVTRRNPREDLQVVLEQGSRILGQGKSILVFPQSTRSVEFDPERFNSIGVKLARRAGVPVVPLAVRTDFHGIGRRIKDFGRITRSSPVRVRFAEAVPVTGNGRAAHDAVVDFVSRTLAEWGMSVRAAAPTGDGRNPDADA